MQYIIRGVEDTERWTTAKIAAIRHLASEIASQVRARLPKTYSRELVDTLLGQPYCRIGNLVSAGIVGRQAASRYLKALASIGVLEERRILVIRSRFLHRVLGVLLIVAGIAYTTHGLVKLFFPTFENADDQRVTMVARGLGEVPIILWLLIKGVRSDPPTTGSTAAVPA